MPKDPPASGHAITITIPQQGSLEVHHTGIPPVVLLGYLELAKGLVLSGLLAPEVPQEVAPPVTLSRLVLPGQG